LLTRLYLLKIASLQQLGELLFRQRQNMFRGFLELSLFIVIDVHPLALGKPVNEKRLGAPTEQDDSPVAFRPSLSRPGDPLLDDPTPKVGVDLAFIGSKNRFAESRIRNPFLLWHPVP
jgi:hypothetical protein